MTLDAFFNVRSVAVIGASDDPTRIGGRPIKALKTYWRPTGGGRIFPVNPSRETVQGLVAYRDISDIPEQVDLAIIAVPAIKVADCLDGCAQNGCRSVIIFSSGFSEKSEEGRNSEQSLAEKAKSLGIRLLGPNCLGLLDMHQGLYATFSDLARYDGHLAGPVGIASQSGAVMSQIVMLSRSRRVGISKALSFGNASDVELAESIRFLVDDPHTGFIIAYCEMVQNGSALCEAFIAARKAGKQIVIIKGGKSAAGQQAAATHTGALAGEDRIFEAVLAQYGVERANSLDDVIDMAYLFCRAPKLTGTNLAVATISGGAGVLMADAAEAHGLTLGPLPARTATNLASLLPYASITNPLDTTAQAVNDLDVWSQTMAHLSVAGYDVLLMYLAHFGQSEEMFGRVTDAMRTLPQDADCPVIYCTLFSPETRARAEELGFLTFEEPERALRAIGSLARAQRPLGNSFAEETAKVGERIEISGPLSEADGKALLRRYGIRTPQEKCVASVEAALDAAESIGYPVVLKISSPLIPHKSDIGGVCVGISDARELAKAFDYISSNVRLARPDVDPNEMLLCQQVGGGTEIILGSAIDPNFGTLVLLGAGGIMAELLNETTFRRLVHKPEDANAMIDALPRTRQLLDGVRGRPKANREDLVATILKFSRLVDSLQGTATVEINPLLVTDERCIALDALVLPKT